MTSVAVPGWRADAACRGEPVEMFFPAWGRRFDAAKRICEECPVSGECLAAALAMDSQYGVWGGLTARERKRLARA
ncbi:MAG: WhiB family transcriptional regulator [Acidimicrobiaceae bacterium]|nr:WhiB family transcriptional regulator [Acidimicrobiaceae bacterium]